MLPSVTKKLARPLNLLLPDLVTRLTIPPWKPACSAEAPTPTNCNSWMMSGFGKSQTMPLPSPVMSIPSNW
jgi:hypothetical protein